MDQASLYQRANIAPRRDAKKIMAQYGKVMQWRTDCQGSLIDIGTGSGDVLMDFIYPEMPKNYKLIMGTDISPAMVRHASKYYESFERSKFQILDIGCEVLPEHLCGAFNHVTSFYCLHWVQNQKRALQNIYHLLRSTGGDCLLVFLGSCLIFDVYKTLAQQKKWCNYMQDYQQFVSPFQHSDDPGTEFSKLLQEAGFNDCIVEIQDDVHVYDDVKMYRDLVRSVCPFFERIPTDRHEEYLDDFVNTVVNMSLHQSKGKVISHHKLIVAYARKNGDCLESGVDFLASIIREGNNYKDSGIYSALQNEHLCANCIKLPKLSTGHLKMYDTQNAQIV